MTGPMEDTPPPVVRVRRLNGVRDADLSLPRYMTEGAAGADVCAAIDAPVALEPLERALVPTGLALAIPAGFEAQVRPRSGLAWRDGLTVLNAPGTIDADYLGELRVLLVNLSADRVVVRRGDRVAQIVVARVSRARFDEVADLEDETARGDGGFGHTGRR